MKQRNEELQKVYTTLFMIHLNTPIKDLVSKWKRCLQKISLKHFHQNLSQFLQLSIITCMQV
jgi:uncharacterized protein (DUF2461 family)